MRALWIQGSNHRGGNTEKVFDYLRERIRFEDETVVDFSEEEVGFCLGCDYCLSHQGECVVKDRMKEIYSALFDAQVVIIVSPVYFSSFPSKIKAMFDRCQLFFNLKDKSGVPDKIFAGVHLAGSRPYDTQFAGIKGVYKYWLRVIKAREIGCVDIPDTDRVFPLDDRDTLRRLDDLIKNIEEESSDESFK